MLWMCCLNQRLVGSPSQFASNTVKTHCCQCVQKSNTCWTQFSCWAHWCRVNERCNKKGHPLWHLAQLNSTLSCRSVPQLPERMQQNAHTTNHLQCEVEANHPWPRAHDSDWWITLWTDSHQCHGTGRHQSCHSLLATKVAQESNEASSQMMWLWGLCNMTPMPCWPFMWLEHVLFWIAQHRLLLRQQSLTNMCLERQFFLWKHRLSQQREGVAPSCHGSNLCQMFFQLVIFICKCSKRHAAFLFDIALHPSEFFQHLWIWKKDREWPTLASEGRKWRQANLSHLSVIIKTVCNAKRKTSHVLHSLCFGWRDFHLHWWPQQKKKRLASRLPLSIVAASQTLNPIGLSRMNWTKLWML